MQMIQHQLTITSEIKYLELVRKFILETIRRTNFPPENENRIVLATDEAVTNIIEHGYQFKKQGHIDIKVEITDEKIQINISDTGRNFNPDVIEKPNIMEWVKQGRRKGLGIYLMRQVMDEVKYTFKTGQNQLLLVKYLREKPDRRTKGV